MDMVLTEYNEALHEQVLREEGRREGRGEGRAEGRGDVNALNIRLLNDNRLDDLKRAAADAAYQAKLLMELFPERGSGHPGIFGGK